VRIDRLPPQGEAWTEEDDARHEATYRAFVKGVALFTAHTAVILLVLAYVLL
jgi:hypothetical protein